MILPALHHSGAAAPRARGDGARRSEYPAGSLAPFPSRAAGEHYSLLVFGLILSIILMATAANLISGWIKKYRWIAWAGLLAILVVAVELIYTDIKIIFS